MLKTGRTKKKVPKGTTKRGRAKPLVGIVMGSQSDWRVAMHATTLLQAFGVPFEAKIRSAHRTPDRMRDYAMTAHKRGIKVIIAFAGGSAHLPGMVAAFAPGVPVLGVPVNDKDGNVVKDLAARGSMDEMPPGVPLAVFSLGKPGAENAAQFAALVLAVNNDRLFNQIVLYRKILGAKVADEPVNEPEVKE